MGYRRGMSEIRQQPESSTQQTRLEMIQNRSGPTRNGRIRATAWLKIDCPARGESTSRRRGDNVIHMPATKLNQIAAKIGFIGLGLMGSRLARRLHTTGWKIRAWNRSPQPAAEISKEGIATSPSVAELITDSDVIVSSLANDAAVRSVY